MKALRVSVCMALCLAGVPSTAQNEDAPSAEFLDFLADWDAQDQQWLDEEMESENHDHANTNDEEPSDED